MQCKKRRQARGQGKRKRNGNMRDCTTTAPPSSAFMRSLEAQRERARSASQFGLDYNALVKVDIETRFQGYDGTEGQGSVVALFRDGEQVEALSEGEKGVAVLDQTPFYAESGGQVGDTGFLRADGVQAEVSDTTKAGNAHLHHVVVQQGSLRVGEQVQAQVAEEELQPQGPADPAGPAP